MKINISKQPIIPLITMMIILINGCSSLPQFSSYRTTKEIVIDGNNNEWKSVPAYIDKNNTFAVSVCHDTEYISMCLIIQDHQVQRQIMGDGLTVWIDNEGGNHKKFGINFPLGIHTGGTPPTMDREKTRDHELMRNMMDQKLFEMEIVGEKENERYRLSTINAEGIQAKIERSKEGFLIYELKVPLRATPRYPHAINVQDDSFVGLGVETADIKMPMEKREGGPHGGREKDRDMEFGGSSPGGGGMPQGRPHDAGSKPASVKMWWKIKLNNAIH